MNADGHRFPYHRDTENTEEQRFTTKCTKSTKGTD